MKKMKSVSFLCLMTLFYNCLSNSSQWNTFTANDRVAFTTDDLVHYTNIEYQWEYEIQYPGKWSINRNSIRDSKDQRLVNLLPQIVLLKENQKLTDLINNYKNNLIDTTGTQSEIILENLMIGAYDAYKIYSIYRNKKEGNGELSTPYEYFIQLDSTKFITAAFFPSNRENHKAQMKMVEKILSTIKVKEL